MDGETMETVTNFSLSGSKITADGDCSHEIKKHLLLGRKAMTNLDQHIKKQRHCFTDKSPSSQSYGFSSSHVWMWELDCKASWALKNWCFWAVVLEKTLESPLDCKEIQSVHPKGNQSWILIGRNDPEDETPIFGHLMWGTDHWKRLWCWEGLGAGGEGDNRGWDGWMASSTRWTWVWVNSRRDREAWRAAIHGVAKSQTWLSDWTELMVILFLDFWGTPILFFLSCCINL